MPNNATVTINLSGSYFPNGKIIEADTFNAGDINSLIQLQGSGNLTIKGNATINANPITAKSVESAISTANNSTGSLTFDTGNSYPKNNNTYPVVTGKDYGIKAEGTPTINFNGGQISGKSGIYQAGGTLNVKGGNIYGTGTDDNSAALVLSGESVTANIETTTTTPVINIGTNATNFNTTNALIIANANGDGTNKSTINIKGGSIGNNSNENATSLINKDPYATVDISGGNFVKSLSGNYEVTGGTFSTILEPSKVKANYSLIFDGKTTIYADEAAYNTAQNTIQCSIERGGLTYNFTSLDLAQNNIQVGETLKLGCVGKIEQTKKHKQFSDKISLKVEECLCQTYFIT